MPAKQAQSKIPKDVDTSTTPVADKLDEVLHDSASTVSQHAAKTEEKLRQAASKSADTLSEKNQRVQAHWNNSRVGQFTKENPLATAGIAFIGGVLLTRLLCNKNN